MNAAVTASSQEAADVGAAMLRGGGNAVDAAVAAAFATCVADPSNTGIAGYGGYLVVQRAMDERARCVRFPLTAPSNRSPAELVRTYPESGPACSATPSVLGGLARALQEFGTRSWADVILPAARLARVGVTANQPTARALELHRDLPLIAECFAVDDTGGRLVFRQPALASTLERMAGHEPGWFYAGPLAAAAQRSWRDAGVDVPTQDWVEQPSTVEVSEAATLAIGDARVHAAPLGFSGSACLFAFLAGAACIARERPLLRADALAELAAAMASVWQYRFHVPGANDFDGRDVHEWIRAALAHRSAAPLPEGAGHTAHINAIDSAGTMAALTFTHGPSHFGGRWALPGTGIIMNGGMHNFARPALLRRRGRWFGVSNMTPTVAVTSGGDRIAIGCPGARRIPSNIAMALARHLFGGQDLVAAVAGGRLHAEGDGIVYGERDRLEPGVLEALGGRFARFEHEAGDNYFGPLSAIRRASSGEVVTAVDDRLFQGFSAIV